MQGLFLMDRLVTYHQLDQINQAAEDSDKGPAIKPVLCMLVSRRPWRKHFPVQGH
jgi:Zn-dependent alcohol dehydrogenase